ncbi:MAG TPA: RNA methyltransferase [Algoriphagus sp.]|jgi:TrmH family RNA methyltransferase|uniref:TrmH family RNA methyltransferase n=1 Tax=unclassified Algoriphagus TaxID=2641541 RepID=UPI000C63043A|nr:MULTISPECIES: RNA methyltransferase [unclassified Algoriphagus]MAL14099.1 RNA methyltransferase [Algoriphagus sp.]MAN87735.1 RNA methyltransferase [Algoriphagus sp.]QYH37916.1 RNA methyltransferase [Algoriphagus sp. NBT04N3]HAD51925.1 RNA methyltransferase [Algoriphagus sp.]HAH35391.1 RNA methyltransferase [Algoriphagus sp.]|tara:strand:+ start:305 stop:1051 length:747 start_codon:yes stop_codon:yes gene_type:complete
MLSKNTVKFIKSLHQKKYRAEHQKFFVEGEKSVVEVINSDFIIDFLVATPDFIERHNVLLKKCSFEIIQATKNQLESLGQYQSNDSALAVVKQKVNEAFRPDQNELVVALDDVRDPGNLGTIIRIADWYGIKKLLFSSQTADFYNPKVIQASMGSFTRIQFFYEDLPAVLSSWNLPVYGAFLDGENLHSLSKVEPGVILMGNESKGISPEVEPFVSRKITIPAFGSAESLNVAIATAVLCDNFKRLIG